MKNKLFILISMFLYVISGILFIYYLSLKLKNIILTPSYQTILFLLISLFIFTAGIILTKYGKINSKKILRISLYLCFILYLILLCTLTLFDDFFKRNMLNISSWNKDIFDYYMTNLINVIPFRIIIMFILDLINGKISLYTFILNIFGNLVAFMPFAFFLPKLYKSQNNTKTFLKTMFLIVLTIETLQLITLSGVWDIDDIILNTLGAYIMFKILKIKQIDNLVNKIIIR